MDNYTFPEKKFHNLVFNSKLYDKAFLRKWNNIECVNCYLHRIWTPVEWAADRGYLDVVKFLVENGADITLDVNFTICTAMNGNYVNVIKYLLSTNIYTEEYIQTCIEFVYNTPEINELLDNYRQFSNTKACR